MQTLHQILARNQGRFSRIIDQPLDNSNVKVLDFSAANTDLLHLDLSDTRSFNAYVFHLLDQAGVSIGVGGYREERVIYKRSQNFAGNEARTTHLGIDIWTRPYENVYAPLDATVHSFADNKGFGNYGPTIILKHHLQGATFHTLYGHLNRRSMEELTAGKIFRRGEKIGEIGDFPENGDWPAHLHFQVIENMTGYYGDYPGVAAPSEKEKYLDNCPDPNLILGIEKLRTV